MNWISVLICCVTLRTRGVSIMGLTRKRAHIPISVLSQDLGKEEWDIRGKMLFSNEIIPTTEFHESTTCSPIEDEESEETPPSLLVATTLHESSTHKVCSQAYISVKNRTISKSRKKTHPQIISKSRNKISRKNQRMKRSISLIEPIYNVNNNEEIDFNKRSEQQIVDTSEIDSNYSSRIYQYTADQNNVNSVKNELSPVQDKSNRSSNIIMPKQSNVEKRKRENGWMKTSTNFNMDNYWETPTCQMIGDGVNHVCVQYSSPPLFNGIKEKLNSSTARNQNDELQNKNIDKNNESIESLNESSPDDEKCPPAYNKHISGDMKFKSEIIEDPFNVIQKLDSGLKNGNHDILHGERNNFIFGSNDDISKHQNNVIKQDWNKINDHWINLNKNPESKERISDYIPSRIQSNIVSKPVHKRMKGLHLPIDITIAMKNLFNQLNPMDVNVTNSSYISPDGSLEFNIQLRDKAAQLKNPI